MSSTISEFVKNCSQKIKKEVFDTHQTKNTNCKEQPVTNDDGNGGGAQGKFAFLKLNHRSNKDNKEISTGKNVSSSGNNNKGSAYVVEMSVISQQSEKEQEAEYDPYKNRKVNHPTSNLDTLLHLLKGSLGTGILSMPIGFSHSGYVLGIIGTIIIGLICTYCIHLLISTQYELCRRKKVPSMTYNGTTETALKEGPRFFRSIAPYSAHIVNVFLLTYQMGTCCVYFVFISENVKKVAESYLPGYSIQMYMLAFLIPIMLLNSIKNLKRLAPVSSIANVITVISYGIIAYYLFENNPTLENRNAFGPNIGNYPLFFGTVLFALEAIGVMLPLENEMKHPRKFLGHCGILNNGMYAIILLYAGVGLLGYMAHGDNVKGSITLNLPNDDMLAKWVILLLALSIFLSYTLQFYVAIRIVWDEYIGPKFDKNPRKNIYEYFTRYFLIFITFCLAAAFPKIDLFISLLGSLTLSMLGIGIPAVIELSAYWYSKTGMSFVLMLLKDLLLIIISFIGLISGTYSGVQNIIKDIFKPIP